MKSFQGAAIAKLAKIHDLSKKARIRLEILDFIQSHPISVTCHWYGITRSTVYRWKKKESQKHEKP
ncbi:MAG: helix-turn-helix domain-containing protein [Atribacterota bacterium]